VSGTPALFVLPEELAIDTGVAQRLIAEFIRGQLRQAGFEAADGQRFKRDVIHHPGAVSVVAVRDDGRAVLVRQFRAPIDGDLLVSGTLVRQVGAAGAFSLQVKVPLVTDAHGAQVDYPAIIGVAWSR